MFRSLLLAPIAAVALIAPMAQAQTVEEAVARLNELGQTYNNAPIDAAALAEAEKPARTPEEEAKHALIAAALERAKAQKEQAHPENTSNLSPEQQAEIAAIEARRAEIREQAKPHLRADD